MGDVPIEGFAQFADGIAEDAIRAIAAARAEGHAAGRAQAHGEVARALQFARLGDEEDASAASARAQKIVRDLMTLDKALGPPALAETAPPVPEERQFYLLSVKWTKGDYLVWWRTDSRGYTCRLADAGEYTAAEARRLAQPSTIPVPCAEARALVTGVVALDEFSRRWIAVGVRWQRMLESQWERMRAPNKGKRTTPDEMPAPASTSGTIPDEEG